MSIAGGWLSAPRGLCSGARSRFAPVSLAHSRSSPLLSLHTPAVELPDDLDEDAIDFKSDDGSGSSSDDDSDDEEAERRRRKEKEKAKAKEKEKAHKTKAAAPAPKAASSGEPPRKKQAPAPKKGVEGTLKLSAVSWR